MVDGLTPISSAKVAGLSALAVRYDLMSITHRIASLASGQRRNVAIMVLAPNRADNMMPSMIKDKDSRVAPPTVGATKLPNRIRELREHAGVTQADLADRIGTTFQTISKLERQNRKLNVGWMVRIAQALGVEPSDLIKPGADEPAPMRQGEFIHEPQEIALLRLWRQLDFETKAALFSLARSGAMRNPGDL